MVARIRNTDETGRTVQLDATHPVTGEPVHRTFWISSGPGPRAVREGDAQVCKRLANIGPTLTAADNGDHLRHVIRVEWTSFRTYLINRAKT